MSRKAEADTPKASRGQRIHAAEVASAQRQRQSGDREQHLAQVFTNLGIDQKQATAIFNGGSVKGFSPARVREVKSALQVAGISSFDLVRR